MLAKILYQNPRYFALFMLVIVSTGLTSFNSIGRQEDPNITNFVASVTTFLPGATPERVEALVTRPLEEELMKIAEVNEVNSTSSNGVSFIHIALHETLSDEKIELSWTEIRDALGDAAGRMPAAASTPAFDNDRMASYSYILAISSRDEQEIPLSLLNRISLDLSDKIRNLSGTKIVDSYGEPEEEIRVEIDEEKLIARGLSIQGVAAALAAADPKVAAGRAVGSGMNLQIEVSGEFDSLERIRQVTLRTASNGASIVLGDIARVYKSQQSPPASMVINNGKPGILLAVAMEEDLQVDRWVGTLTALVEDFKKQLPDSVSIEATYDQSSYTLERLTAVGTNLAIGVSLVIFVLLFTMGWRAAIVVAVILPACGLLSITVLDLCGLAIHQMSISGLIVALGLVVDGSIVMTDEVRKRLNAGTLPLPAIAGSVHRLRVPLLASTITTVLTFIPLIILPGPAGDFLGSIAFSVVAMLITSFILALTITPVLAAWLLPKKASLVQGHWWTQGLQSSWSGEQLEKSIDWSLRYPYAAIALALVLPITGFLSFPTLTAQFFPGSDRDQFYIQLQMDDGRAISDTLALVKQIDEKLRATAEIRRVDWTLGESPPAFYYNMHRNKESQPNWAEALILTNDPKLTDELIRNLQHELDAAYPSARIIIRGLDQGPPVTAPLEYEIYGNNLTILRDLGDQLRLRMEKVASVTHTNATLNSGAPKIQFQLDETKLQLAGLNLNDAATALNASLRGAVGGEILEGTERLPVRVRLAEKQWSDIEQIANIRLPLGSANSANHDGIQAVALNTVGRAVLKPSSSPISRLNSERINTVQAFLTRGTLPEEALKEFQQELLDNPISLPEGYRLRVAGDSDERAETVSRIMAPLGLIGAALVATILLTFNSWRLSAVAVLVCICSTGLSLFSLALFAYPFGVVALIGVIGSIGVSINAAIIIMTALQQDPGANAGGRFAIRKVVMDSSRHIISTTITTFGGFLPLIMEGGGFWPPFAMSIAGGVLLSTIVSFFLVPPLFLVLRTGEKKQRVVITAENQPAGAVQ